MMNNDIHFKIEDEITYPFQTSVEQRLKFGLNKYVYFTEHVITYPCWE